MQMIQFKCPECGRSVETVDDRSHKRISCPHCLETVLVPRQAKPLAAVAETAVEETGLLPWLNDGIHATCIPVSLEGDNDGIC
jgi:DNA-directed RNA polymerase subunit RPC12/RpoP